MELHGLPVCVNQHGDSGGPEERDSGQIDNDRRGLRLLEKLGESGAQARPRDHVDLAGHRDDDRRTGPNWPDPERRIARLGGTAALHADDSTSRTDRRP
jgi:hypothetical protein